MTSSVISQENYEQLKKEHDELMRHFYILKKKYHEIYKEVAKLDDSHKTHTILKKILSTKDI